MSVSLIHLNIQMRCTFCNFENSNNHNIFCSNCGKVILIGTSNFFDVFGIEQSFELDLGALNTKLIEFLSKIHPDKFVNATQVEKEISMENSRLLNNMFKVLKDPILRAQYMLRQQEIDIESAKIEDMEFLSETIEWREGGIANDDIQRILDDQLILLSRFFKDNQYDKALQIVLKLKFIKRFMDELSI